MAADEVEKARDSIFRDIRRYYCEFCGICRSKKVLIAAHIRTHHEEEIEENELNEKKEHGEKLNVCEECGASFRKPAHLKQHMQSHSLERPFVCSVDDCHSSYRRKDHLTRHMLQHQGKLIECTFEGCKVTFTLQGNMTRHVKEFHDESAPSEVKQHVCSEHGCGKVFKYLSKLKKHEDSHGKVKEFHDESAPSEVKQHVCSEHGCGKVFKYLSKLKKHEDSHVKLDSVEAFCADPGCMKYFSNEQCLKEHIRSCHQHITCDQCGTRQLKKNIKRHMRMHVEGLSSESIKCSFKACTLTFSTTSNLNQHIKAVHLELKPFVCGMTGCHERFAFKHVRNRHEQTGCHIYTPGNFEESDLQFRSRPRGGRKRKYPVIETLLRKRIVPPSESELVSNDEYDNPSW